MRILGRLLLVVAFASIAGVMLYLSLTWYSGESGWFGSGRSGVTRATAYRLSPTQWLEFGITESGPLRVLSNAAFSTLPEIENADARPDRRYYAIDFEIIDATGAVFQSGRYHHRASVTLLHDPTLVLGGPLVPRTSYADSDHAGSKAEEFRLSAIGLALPAQLRMRRAEVDPMLREISVRAYQQQELSARKSKTVWQRLSRRARERRTRGFALPPARLQPIEVAALTRVSWRPLGPRGVEGEDYAEHRLLIVNDPGLVPYHANSATAKRDVIEIWPELRTVVAVVDESGPLAIRFASTRPDSKPSALNIRFIPSRPQDAAWELERLVPREGVLLERETRDGWLEFTSPDRIRGSFEESEDDAGARRPIGLATTLSAFDLEPASWMPFDVHHATRRPTPIRVDVRKTRSASTPAAGNETGAREEDGSAPNANEIEYQLRDAADQIVGRGTFSLLQVTSLYDRSLRGYPEAARVSDPDSFFLALPPGISRLELRGPSHHSVLVYSRPPDLPRVLRVPGDYRPVIIDGNRIPAWFSIRPNDADELARAGRLHRIVVQPRPREIDPRIVAGDYQWESFRPNGDWVGSDLLSPRENRTPLRLSALSSSYLALSVNEVQTVELSASQRRKRVRPRLVFVRTESHPASVQVDIDGVTVAAERIAGRHGSIELPMLAVGKRQIRIQSDPQTRWFVNHARDEGTRLSQQLGIRFDSSSPLEFDFVKRDAEELLTLLIHSPADAKNLSQVQVELIAPDVPTSQALAGWTQRERRFEVAPRMEESVFVLDTADGTTSLGQRLFVPLGSDLPAGSYRLRIALATGPPSYVSLYRVRTGTRVVRRILREDTI